MYHLGTEKNDLDTGISIDPVHTMNTKPKIMEETILYNHIGMLKIQGQLL